MTITAIIAKTMKFVVIIIGAILVGALAMMAVREVQNGKESKCESNPSHGRGH